MSLGLALFGAMLVLMALRMPIAIAMFVPGAVGYVLMSGWDPLLNHLKGAVFGRFSVYDLSVIPLFMLMGAFAMHGGLSKALFDFANGLLGRFRGGMAMAGILACAAFGSISGSSVATTATIAQVALPEMRRIHYSGRLATAALAAGGTLGILIPPSVMLIVMGPVLGVSVADLYAAAFGPGFLLAGLYLLYLFGRAFFNPKLGPPVPREERVTSPYLIVREVVIGVLPLLGLIAATLGSILAGLATPTEAAGIGSLGALILAAIYRRLTYAGMKRAVISATATSSMVLLLAVTSNIFGSVFARLGTANWITESLLALPIPPVMMLAVVLVLIFLLGWPFEWPAIILVFLPIFYPVMDGLKPALAQSLGIQIDMLMVWFGTVVAVTLQTAYLSPPVAMSAYYLKQVVKEWSLSTIYKGMFEFMALQCLAIALCVIFPAIATWFPEHLQYQARQIQTEEVDDSANRLEEDPLKGSEEQPQEEPQEGVDALEKDELSTGKK